MLILVSLLSSCGRDSCEAFGREFETGECTDESCCCVCNEGRWRCDFTDAPQDCLAPDTTDDTD